MKNDKLIDYVFSAQSKQHIWQYSLGYWLAHVQRILITILHWPLCVVGYHPVADGIFHEYINEWGDVDSYKCYHCRYCDTAIDKAKCMRDYMR